jgi:hypothetical protein
MLPLLLFTWCDVYDETGTGASDAASEIASACGAGTGTCATGNVTAAENAILNGFCSNIKHQWKHTQYNFI